MATATGSDVTLTRPDRPPSSRGRTHSSWVLPPDLLADAVRRLRAVALLHAVGFLLAGPLATLLSPGVGRSCSAIPSCGCPRRSPSRRPSPSPR